MSTEDGNDQAERCPASEASDHRPIREVEWTTARSIRRGMDSQTKDTLTARARSVFIERGYEATKIGEITSAAHVSRATFYVYFATKEEIFLLVLSQLRDEILAAHSHPQTIADDDVLLSRASVSSFTAIFAQSIELIDEAGRQAGSNAEVRGLFDEMIGRPYRRTLRHIARMRESGAATPQLDDEYVAGLMWAINRDAAIRIRQEPSRREYFVDQATLAYLAMVGFHGDVSRLRSGDD